jgi:uncharacterized membrane protein YjjB (DUF3815 family)
LLRYLSTFTSSFIITCLCYTMAKVLHTLAVVEE